jgi:hypothetical protein
MEVLMINSYMLLKDATTTGPGPAINVDGRIISDGLLQLTIIDADASISALTFAFEGSNNGVNWITIKTYQLTANELLYARTANTAAGFHLIDKPTPIMRVNILTLTGASGNDSVSISYCGK